ncbi:MAG: hypothetical protein IJU50_06695, partial [Lachnospiraceae bacterium]|nr:hypothetical protein [Lachnospiraceae bacterium]
MKGRFWGIIISLWIIVSFTLNMTPIPVQEIANDNLFIRAFVTVVMSMQGYGLLPFLALPMLVRPVCRMLDEGLQWTIAVPACLLALFQSVGKSFHEAGSFIYAYYDLGQFIK